MTRRAIGGFVWWCTVGFVRWCVLCCNGAGFHGLSALRLLSCVFCVSESEDDDIRHICLQVLDEFSIAESLTWHNRDARTRDQVDYLQKLLRPQADASISLDASATNLSLEANELSKADTPVKEPAEAEASKLLAGEDLQDGTGSLLAGL